MRRKRSEWEMLVAEFSCGGETHEVFCERHELNVGTFRWWLGKLRRKRSRAPAASRKSMRLLPIRVRAETPTTSPLVDVLVHGAVLRIAVGTDVDYVSALASAFTARC